MELKSEGVDMTAAPADGFNRTFMELKFKGNEGLTTPH